MPNHVTNVVTYTGDSEEINKMLEEIKNVGRGVGTIDYYRIIPMPNDLKIESSSRCYKGIEMVNEYLKSINIESSNPALKDILSKRDISSFDEDTKRSWELGIAATLNKEKYGAPTWYEWTVDNWGTKWNAYGYEDNVDYSKDNELRFSSAWSAPHNVIERLSEMYPTIKFTHKWADECIGENCGKVTYYNGHVVGVYCPDVSREQYELFAEVMNINLADYNLKLNATEDDYVWTDRHHYKLYSLQGKPTLYTDKMLTDENVPIGFNVYYANQNPKNEEFSYISNDVTEHFAGTIITEELLDVSIPMEIDSASFHKSPGCKLYSFDDLIYENYEHEYFEELNFEQIQ